MLLHDHYKDSFSLIREREKQRDRSFLVVIFLFVLLFLEVDYPINFSGTVDSLDFSAAKIIVSSMPRAAMLDASWALALAIVLAYCRVSLAIERQYVYLHRLENWISTSIDAAGLYQREGGAYVDAYPLFLNWAWFCYVVLFPGAAILATATLIVSEWRSLPYPEIHKWLDSVLAMSLLVSLFLHGVLPRFTERLKAAKLASRLRWLRRRYLA